MRKTRQMTSADAAWLDHATALVARPLSARREAVLRYAMGQCCDDVQDYESAFAHYQRANTLQQTGSAPYDRVEWAREIDQQIRVHTPEGMRRHRDYGCPSERPVFVIGMPRLGAALIGQIIAAHPAVWVARELRYWADAAGRHADACRHAAYSPALAHCLAEAALADWQRRAPVDAVRVVDNTPGNFQYLGLIHTVFPRARLLHIHRHPIDHCLSLYFRNSAAAYANDLADLAHYYREYHRLIGYWRALLPPEVFLDIPYEAVVTDPQGWSRRIIEFMDLDWADYPPDFQPQVDPTRKGRWYRYADVVQPLLPLLGFDQAAMRHNGLATLEAQSHQAHSLFLAQRYSAALQLYDGLLKQFPQARHLQINRASCLAQLGELTQAEDAFQQALASFPNHPVVLSNLAALYGQMGKNAEALALFDQVLALTPDSAEAWQGRSAAYANSGQSAQAGADCRQAIDLDPALPTPRLLQAMLAAPIMPETPEASAAVAGQFQTAIAELERWATGDPRHQEALGGMVGNRQPFALAYRPGNLRPALSAYGEVIAAAARVYGRQNGLTPIAPPPRARIRLGIVNGQMRRHSVWDIILKGLIQHLDRSRFELALYHTGRLTDAETRWAETQADQFVTGPLGYAEWLQRLRDDALDVLFLPEVGMDPLTCKLAALRLAPLQVASWGHPVTTGLPEIDLFCSGDLLEPPDAQTHYRERLIRLPGTGVCTEPLSDPVQPLPADWLVPRLPGGMRLVLCQRPFKCDPADDALLARVVRAAAPCQLYLLRDRQWPWASDRLNARLSVALSAEGLDSEAVLIERPWLQRGPFFAMLDAMDLYLDPPAFSGYTTAWQALRRGIPILTREGASLRQRLAAGLLRRVGLPETIARDDDDYVAIAARLAAECRDPAARAHRRERILAAAPRADHDVQVVRAFETTLIDALAERGRPCTGN